MPDESMVTFLYEDRRYRFDAVACKNGSNLVRLPDNRVLRILTWSAGRVPWPNTFTLAVVADPVNNPPVLAERV